ncbi:helix-turn-helix domain-containing protein [Blautia pseudococcoides]|uniref:helix-turn-helix domain-containing protein n=2 Tax=Bacteria TaxID=2 RepID=UPI001A9A9212|nr:helix-turn-helix domain-containing protein [Blautia pseudococcoides]
MKTANIRLPELFGDRISFLRKLKGLTQAQLAEKLGISAQAVSKWESGLSCPDIMMLVPLADIFNVSTDMLLGGGQLTGCDVTPNQNAEADREKGFPGQTAAEGRTESSKETQNRVGPEWQVGVEWQNEPEEDSRTGEEETGGANGYVKAASQTSAADAGGAGGFGKAGGQAGAADAGGAQVQSKTEEQVKAESQTGEAAQAKAEESADWQSQTGQGTQAGPSDTEGQRTQENVNREADRAGESGMHQDSSNRRKWEENWKNGTLEIRKVFRENNVMIHSLHIDIGMADAIIREGDEFALDLSCYPNGDCREEVRDGVWKIKDRGYKDLFLLSNITNIFSERKIIIIIPRGYHFKDVKIKLGAGKLVGRGILTDSSSLDLGAGEIVLADYYSGDAKIKCGMGKVMLEGQMRGRCKLDCGMGEIAASLVAPSEYGYRVKVGMGDVRVGENRLGGMGGTYKVNNNAENFFDINCGMGAVKVLFDE